MRSANSLASRLDPKDMALRGRIGAFCLHATHDPRRTTAQARAAFLTRFEADVDPRGVLELGERRRRAMAARRAYFAQLAMRSVQARRQRAAGQGKSI